MYTVAELSLLVDGLHHKWTFRRSHEHKYSVDSIHQKPLNSYQIVPTVVTEVETFAYCWANGQLTDKFLRDVIAGIKQNNELFNPIH